MILNKEDQYIIFKLMEDETNKRYYIDMNKMGLEEMSYCAQLLQFMITKMMKDKIQMKQQTNIIEQHPMGGEALI